MRAPNRMRLAELRQEPARQVVHAAVDADHVRVEMADLLAQQLEERRVHERFLVHEEPEELDRRLRPALLLQELARRVAVELADDLGPGVVARRARRSMNGLSARSHIASQVAPRSRSGRWAPMRCGLRVDLAKAMLAAEEVAPSLGIVHREVVRGEPELLDVGERELVRARDAHRTRLGVQAVRERLAHRVDAPADALLRFEDDRIVAGAQELRRGREPRHAGADDDDALARSRHGGQPVLDDAQVVAARITARCYSVVSPRYARRMCGCWRSASGVSHATIAPSSST